MTKITHNLLFLIVLALGVSASAQVTKTWNGSVDSKYSTAANWTPSGVPTNFDSAIIPAGTQRSLSDMIIGIIYLQNLTIKAGANVKSTNISILPGGELLIEAGGSLTATAVAAHEMTLESNSTSYASVIADEWNMTLPPSYKLWVNKSGTTGVSGGNDLVSSPLGDIPFTGFADINTNLIVNNGQYGFGEYSKTNNNYVNFSVGTTKSIKSGTGYRTGIAVGGTFTFTGAIERDLTDRTVAITDASSGNAWNLIGNPFAAHLAYELFYDTNNAELEPNGGYDAIYGYNGKSGWDVYNAIKKPTSGLITPGQGFFVKAKSGGGTISFTKDMRRTGISDDFIAGRPANTHTVLSKLKLSSTTQNAFTSIYFLDGATRGMDAGYDAGVFTGQVVNFSIYTGLVESTTGKVDLAIQALPLNDYNNVIVPLGIKAQAGVALTISIDNLSTVPSEINVYLGDLRDGTLHLLNDGAYAFTPSVALDGSDRFQIIYASTTLSVKDFQKNNEDLRIYTTATPKALVIRGQLNKATTAKLYDIQGRLVLSTVLSPNTNVNTMDISTIGTGIYVVKVANDNQVKTQKVIIR